MPHPIALCVENMSNCAPGVKFMCCVAVPGRKPGLRLNHEGKVQWQCDDSATCELWVSADNKLILYRPLGAVSLTVRRAGRSLDVPYEKPVVIVHKDVVDIGSVSLRIHIHGEAPCAQAPTAYVPPHSGLAQLSKAAATVAIIGGLAAAGCSEIEVRDTPPVVVVPDDLEKSEVESSSAETPPEPKIEVREAPPDIVIDEE